MSTSAATTGPLRRVPVQGRSVARVQRMLDACAELVDEVGYEGLTTTLLAERAEVAIGSVYQFFPDKRAIVQALTLRNMEAYLQRLAERLRRRRSRPTGGTASTPAIDEYIAMHRTVPGFRTLHFGDVVDLHLLDEERDNNGVIADQLARAAGRPVRPDRRAAAAVRAGDRGRGGRRADQARVPARRRRRRAVLTEAKALIREYLHRQVDGPPTPADRRRRAPGVGVRGTPGPRPGRSGTASRPSSSPSTRCSSSTCSHSSPALACRNQTRSPTRSRSAAAPASGVCTSPAPSVPSSCSPAGSHGVGSRLRLGRAGGDPAAAEHGGDARRRAADHRQGEERGRAAAARRGSASNSVGPYRPGAGGDLGDRRVGAGRGHAAGAAAVDELQVGVLADRGHRGAAPGQQLRGTTGAASAADRRAAQRLPGRRVAQPGDLRLVRHEPDQPEARAGRRPRRPARRPRSAQCTGERRTPTCSRPPSGRQEASRSRQTRSSGRAGRAAPTASIRSSWSALSTIRVTAAASAASAGQLGQRRPVGGRVGDQHVVA